MMFAILINDIYLDIVFLVMSYGDKNYTIWVEVTNDINRELVIDDNYDIILLKIIKRSLFEGQGLRS